MTKRKQVKKGKRPSPATSPATAKSTWREQHKGDSMETIIRGWLDQLIEVGGEIDAALGKHQTGMQRAAVTHHLQVAAEKIGQVKEGLTRALPEHPADDDQVEEPEEGPEPVKVQERNPPKR